MLSKNMIEKMNKQINLEFFSSNLYLQMAAWAEGNGLPGSASFLRTHAAEEMMHMEKLFTYLLETGDMPILGTIEAPPAEYDSLESLFRMILEHEKLVTQKINELAGIAMEEKDFSTFNFLQWYVAEQHEEENLINTILDKFKVIGTEGRGLYMIDQEVAKMTITPQA